MSEQTTLYKFYNENKELLYVGITSQKDNRWSQHKATKPWWKEQKYVVSHHYDTRQEALLAEEQSIKLEKPKYNIQHNEANIHFGIVAYNQNTFQGQKLIFELFNQRPQMGVGENKLHGMLIYTTFEAFKNRCNNESVKRFEFCFDNLDFYKTKRVLDSWLQRCLTEPSGKSNHVLTTASSQRFKEYLDFLNDHSFRGSEERLNRVVNLRKMGTTAYLFPALSDPSHNQIEIEDFDLITLKGSNLES